MDVSLVNYVSTKVSFNLLKCMHIVYVSREYPPSHRGGGIASYLKIMAEGFASKGHKVTVIAASDDTRDDSDEYVNGVRVIRLSGGDFLIHDSEPGASKLSKLRFLYRFHAYRKKVRDIVKTIGKIDVIEVAEYGAEGLYLNELGIPIVFRLHTPALLDHNNFSQQKLSFANCLYYYAGKKELDLLKEKARFITSCSTSLKEWAIKYAGVTPDKVKVIYNPLQSDFITSDDENPVILSNTVFFAGTICDWKGAGNLVEACRILNDVSRGVSLEMAGKTGAYGESLKAHYQNCDWLHILGKLPQSELKKHYSTSSVVCFPSWWENMPMVCIEAMAQGAVVIGSNSGGMAEIIEDGKSGFLLPPKNPQLWADKIREVLSMPNVRRREISLNAKVRIQNVFSLDKILDDTISYYDYAIREFYNH